MMRSFFIASLLFFSQIAFSQDIADVAAMIREGQMMDETVDWKYYGAFSGKLQGIDNEMTAYLETVEPNTTVRMYLVAKTDCIVYFDVTDRNNAYVFGTKDPLSLESDLGNGFKGATSMFTFEENFTLNINFGLRWGCQTMLDTEMKLLVFYASKNAD